ncbi:galactose-binding domain-like protein [Boletus reticuloceps]|uniref:Galactose-binding domain-like protein n=1 Tax=Boletus reticuloceps TaxID=495285 RepID=A0A8I2YK10_9AGAM|nr:galactose-binding domain-like protein [Boletus reticuloceps]
MPDNHHHHHNEGCGHESHDHDHDSGDLGPNDNLFPHIDRPHVVALNAVGPGASVIKPWHARMNEQVYLESDADEQLIIRVPFTGSVKLRSLLLKAGPGDQTPQKIALFANEPSLDFDDVSDKSPAQEFEVAVGREVGEYAVRATKFTNVTSVTLFIPSNQGADTTRVYYIGFLGQWTQRKSNPVITVYEAQANIADHDKVQGTEGAFSTPHT